MVQLYSTTLQDGGTIYQACYGSFSAPKAQEIVAHKGKVGYWLYLYNIY